MGRPKKVYSIDNLTKKQEEIYEYIKDCVQKRNYPPLYGIFVRKSA